MKCGNYKIPKLRHRSRGYILISLMLFLSVLAIAALAVLPSMAFQVRRDREEEMIHRGVAYSRGIRRFYKKFGRYPMRIEELEDTNNLRFIRKRYQDPITNEDFKILHMGDVGLLNMPIGPQGGGAVPGTVGAPGFSQSTPGQPLQPQSPTSNQVNVGGTASTTVPVNTPATTVSPDSSTSSDDSASSSGFNGPTFGGGPILGVVSASKKQSVREFCKKTHYNDWKFIYDPSTDFGGTLNSPWCPLAAGQGVGTNLNPSKTGTAQPNPAPQGVTPPAGQQPPTGVDTPPQP